jgi:hypothetical protein
MSVAITAPLRMASLRAAFDHVRLIFMAATATPIAVHLCLYAATSALSTPRALPAFQSNGTAGAGHRAWSCESCISTQSRQKGGMEMFSFFAGTHSGGGSWGAHQSDAAGTAKVVPLEHRFHERLLTVVAAREGERGDHAADVDRRLAATRGRGLMS